MTCSSSGATASPARTHSARRTILGFGQTSDRPNSTERIEPVTLSQYPQLFPVLADHQRRYGHDQVSTDRSPGDVGLLLGAFAANISPDGAACTGRSDLYQLWKSSC